MKFDWNDVFLSDLTMAFAIEIVVRTFIMFLIVLIILRMTGKKGVRQLSIFEVAIIIGFGSAAGDPMFTRELGIVPSVIVMVTILLFYRLVTWLAAKNEKFESILEGDPMYIIEDGVFVLANDSDLTFAKDEFLAELRQQNIEHVGQVRVAILETTGNVSLFYYSDEDTKPGLPTLPKVYNQKSEEIKGEGNYACTYCACIQHITATTHQCPRCERKEWVKAIDTKRLA
ncbi:DUF421 domain-containing protein [Mucilaginibacter pallidiroseus]|uniref:DUF421 domain-containing protein n=1 Tax=Mucilaginibacter pallidiroseus TaxID=2599295 RepID=A0A563TZ54_9SPHI|nr:YetF domain-containing protein [Mucilaginibacter pallidiroseus]TWR24032.1 DUF421 domain-containing protein [Mucilaginibacter pallidiroseus]